MSMSKKDFVALADVIRETRISHGWTDKQLYRLAEFCGTQNTNFQPQRWFDYIAGKCGPNGGAVKRS